MFPTEALALDCIQQHVEATDDCYGVSTVITPTTADASLSVCGTTKTFQIVATEDHCSKETTTSVNVLVDSSIQAEQGVCEFSKGPDFPPEVDVSKAKQNCGSVFFASASEAEKCILENVVATDDCRQVDIALASSLVVENDVTDLSICTPVSSEIVMLSLFE